MKNIKKTVMFMMILVEYELWIIRHQLDTTFTIGLNAKNETKPNYIHSNMEFPSTVDLIIKKQRNCLSWTPILQWMDMDKTIVLWHYLFVFPLYEHLRPRTGFHIFYSLLMTNSLLRFDNTYLWLHSFIHSFSQINNLSYITIIHNETALAFSESVLFIFYSYNTISNFLYILVVVVVV